MGWFGKSKHKKQVDAAFRVFMNLFEKTIDGSSDAPRVLSSQLRDSRYRYLLFCLSTVQVACARHMENPDAILNDLLHIAVSGAVGVDPQQFFGGPVDPQQAAVDITKGGNAAAATGIVAGMLRHTESDDPPTQQDADRLWPLAVWIEQSLAAMAGAFTDMAH